MVISVDTLPEVRGKYRSNADLSKTTWFRVGGRAEILFRPADEADLIHFLRNKPEGIPVMVLGLCSNVLVRDGGIDGVVIRLGRGFTNIQQKNGVVEVGAGCLNSHLTGYCIANGVGGLEFLSGIPGSVGGACAMNAGAYDVETKDVLLQVRAVDLQGNVHVLTNVDIGFVYRGNGVPDDWIFTQATFKAAKEVSAVVSARVDEIAQAREGSQPIRARTGGSTFRNPEGTKAWQLIDDVGGRGLKVDGAQVSEKHCNFLINTGDATAADIENLGEEIRKRVIKNFGIDLHWEIKRVGKS